MKKLIPISIAVVATYSVGLWGLYIQPQMLIPLMKLFQVSEAEITQLYGVENFVYFVAILASTAAVTKFSRTKMALIGTLLIVAGNVASAYAWNLELLMVFRAIVSIGGGIISSAGTAAASGSLDPDRVYALSGTIYALIFASGRMLIGISLDDYGVSIESIYLSMAVYGLIVCPVYFMLIPPVKGIDSDNQNNFFKQLISNPSEIPAQIVKLLSDNDLVKLIRNGPFQTLGLSAMFGLFIYELGQNAVFTFMDQLGDNAGLTGAERGKITFLTTVFAMFGGLLATWMGARFGRTKPLIVGLGLNILSGAMFTMMKDPDYYPYLLFLWDISYAFSLPYLMGTLASLDKEGRWAVAGDAFWNFAATPGPIIAGLIVVHSGYNSLALWVFTSGAVGLGMLLYTARKSDILKLKG